MKQLCTLLLILASPIIMQAQVLKGHIIDSNHQSVPGATVYIHELTLGIIADEHGQFQTRLSKGTYTCEVRSMGFERKIQQINIVNENIDVEITLMEKPQALNEVKVLPSKEDPAYQIMRNAIVNSPKHLSQVYRYESENYMKGSVKIEKIPFMMKAMIKDKKILSLEGKLMVIESHNLVNYQFPAKYTQKVVALKSSIPNEFQPKSGMQIPTSSIYDSNYDGNISPLSAKALKYYQFRLEDTFEQGTLQINKIKITPRYSNSKLVSGYIYIIEGNWSVYMTEFTTEEMGTITRYKTDYQEVKPGIFMPITYNVNLQIGTMGVKGFGRFYSSIKYRSLQANEQGMLTVAKEKKTENIAVNKKQQRLNDKIEKLAGKEKMTNREAIKLLKFQQQRAVLDRPKPSLEVKDSSLVKIETDTLAAKRDTLYWENVRKVPLMAEEIASFKTHDSLPASKSVQTTSNSIEIRFGGQKKNSILTGWNVSLGKNTSIRFNGLIGGITREYNFVDGLWMGQTMNFIFEPDNTKQLQISPSVYYTSARHNICWNIDNEYSYAPLHLGKFKLSLGNQSEDLFRNGNSRWLNSLSSLLFADNFIRFYNRKFLSVSNTIDPLNGFTLNTGASLEQNDPLVNHSTFHIFGKGPSENYPNASITKETVSHSTTQIWVNATFTPELHYRIKDGRKIYLNSNYPTFRFSYKTAIDLLSSASHSDYQLIEVAMRQKVRLSEFSSLNYHFSYGNFINSKQLYSQDYKYFRTTPILITNQNFDQQFALLPSYTFMNKQWLESHISLNSDYLLLKRLKPLQRKIFNESLLLNVLWDITSKKPYTETGYTFGVEGLYKIGIFTSFNGSTYNSAGIKLSFPIINLLSRH